MTISANVANVTVTTSWAKLETLISAKLGSPFTFNGAITYLLTNNGGNTITLLDQATAPEDGVDTLGRNLAADPRHPANYVKSGGDMYVRCLYETTDLNISAVILAGS